MDCRTALESNYDELLKLYEEHTEAIEALRLTLSQRILPNIQEDGLLDSQEELTRARNWLEDDGTRFDRVVVTELIPLFSVDIQNVQGVLLSCQRVLFPFPGRRSVARSTNVLVKRYRSEGCGPILGSVWQHSAVVDYMYSNSETQIHLSIRSRSHA